MKKLVFFFVILALSFTAFGGNKDKEKNTSKSLAAKVVAADGSYIAAAKITIRETGESVFSDLEGNFNLTIKTDKPYTLFVESIGYAGKEIKSTELSLFSNLTLKEL